MNADEIAFSTSAFPAEWDVPADCGGRILVSGLRDGLHEAYYLVDFGRRTIQSCHVNPTTYSAQFAGYLREHLEVGQLPYGAVSHEAAVPAFVQPHEGLQLPDGRVAVAMHNCGYLRLIDFEAGTAGRFPDTEAFEPEMLSATNSMDRGREHLYFSTSSLADRARRYADRVSPVRTTVMRARADLSAAEPLYALQTEEAIHETRMAPDGSHLVLTEFCLQGKGPLPENAPDLFESPHKWQAYAEAGLEASKTYLVDLASRSHSALVPDGATPGHVEFSRVKPSRMFLSCHNLSKLHGRLALHGLGHLVALDIDGNSLRPAGGYRDERFFRITSHKVIQYGGASRIVVTVFPNRFYILSDPDLALLKDVELFPHEPLAFAPLAVYPLRPHVPIWIETSSNDRYVILFSNQNIYIYDQDTDRLRVMEGYATGGGFMGTAHITNLDTHV